MIMLKSSHYHYYLPYCICHIWYFFITGNSFLKHGNLPTVYQVTKGLYKQNPARGLQNNVLGLKYQEKKQLFYSS